MKSEVVELESWKKKLSVEVPDDEVRPFIERAYQTFQKKTQVSGFRKGRTPLSIIRQRFAQEVEAEASDEIIHHFFAEAVREHGLPIVAPGSILEFKYKQGEPFTFTAEVQVEPEIEVRHYKGIKFEKQTAEITDEDVRRAMEEIRYQHAELRDTENGAAEGDVIEGAIQALDATGVPIIGQKWDDRVVELGRPPLGDLLASQMLGVKAGEQRPFRLPGQAGPGQEPSGQEKHYLFQVKTVRARIYPEWDADFLKKLGEFQTVSDLEKRIRENLEHAAADESRRMLRDRMADEIVKRNDFELPPAMIDNVVAGLWEKESARNASGLDENEYKQKARPMAVWSLKWEMIWNRIAEAEKITVTEQDLDAEIDALARANEKEEKKIRILFQDPGQRQRVKDRMLLGRIMAYLEENNKIKEVTVKRKQDRPSSLIV
ncbi:trigger factor [bacterium]|nr:trigger factor [bacterium]